MNKPQPQFKYPGIREALDGNTAVIRCEREASDAAGAFPITPSTQMGERWAEAAAAGHINVSGRPLIFIEPEGEHAAAAVTAGLAMTGLRSANFSSGQGIAYMHESLYAAVGKRLTYVLNIGARAMTKATLNVHAGHDDYHCADDTGFFQFFAANAQQAADLNLIAHRIAELALNPGIVAQDGFLTTHLIESIRLPERELVAEYLGQPDDLIDTPTPAQRLVYGDRRRRIPELWDVDNPVMAGVVQNQDAYMQSVAAQRPFFFDHLLPLTEQALDEFHVLTGRRYRRVMAYRADDAEYLIVGQGSLIPSAEAVADYLRKTRKLKVGVVNLLMFRPFPADLIAELLRGRRGVAVLERVDQPLAADPPLLREIRAALGKCLENGRAERGRTPHPGLPAYVRLGDIPQLYAGCYGLGSRDLQPEGLIAAVENMLPEGGQHRQYYLSMDFLHDTPRTPKQREYQETLEAAYPDLRDLALHGSENPNLMPEKSVTVRFHSVGGWGAITTGKNLAMILFDLLGYHIKANPKYGSEKKGQPTTYYLAAAPEPIRVNCEYYYVDVVLSPDPHVLQHSNALAGLRDGGVFIIQSSEATPERVWASIPTHYQQLIVDKNIRLFYLDAFRIAAEEATDADLRLRMQGNAFQGAFFAATALMREAGFTEEKLLNAIERQLAHKFGDRGARVVKDNLRVVERGFDEVREVTDKPVGQQALRLSTTTAEPPLPDMVKRLPQGSARVSDIHRFWEQTGNFYARGMGNDNLADPFMALSVMPASTALFRDMTGIRFEHPGWIAENCTACGNCYTVCPDTAIPGLVIEIQSLLDTVLERVRRQGNTLKHLPATLRRLEPQLRAMLTAAGDRAPVREILDEAMEQALAESADRDALAEEFKLFHQELGTAQFALSRPYFSLPEKDRPGTGGLFNISIDPNRCKGCGECIAVCEDNALVPVTQTDDTVREMRDNWNLWLDLPSTPEHYLRIDNLEEAAGALHTLLLDKQAYLNLTSGDGACLGCTEKTVLHLFTATVEALMRPRVEKHVGHLTELIEQLESRLRDELTHEVNTDDTDAIQVVLDSHREGDLTLADVAASIERLRGGEPIDAGGLGELNRLIGELKALRHNYTDGATGRGRSNMGIVNATGCSSVWGSTFPFNPYPFPWANHLFQDSASMAMGVFEGHMAKMAAGFRAIRRAESLLGRRPRQPGDEEFLARFSWRDFTDEELHLCPPVVVVGGDGAMYDIGFQNLSRAMMSGKPLKILVLDTQVYSNTGGQACTSGFLSQISDMAAYGRAIQGKQEARKEIGLIAMAHRTTYVMQSTIAHANHMIEGFIQGLMSTRPALFNLYCACQPEHGIGDDMGYHQAKLAVESRAYPLFRYDPDAGRTAAECFDLGGNPDLDHVWPTYLLQHRKAGRDQSLELPMTFADFAMTEGRFRKHFRSAPSDTWHDDMLPLADFLELSEDERSGKVPYIWAVDGKQRLSRLLMDLAMVKSCEERRDFWIMLRDIAGAGEAPAGSGVDEARIRQEVVNRLTRKLMQLATEESAQGGSERNETGPADEQPAADKAAADSGEAYLAPWIDTPECTACDECMNINSRMFGYNDQHRAIIKDPQAGPYKDLVRAAENCTARVIHPGLPRDRSARDIDKWIKRGEKYN